MSTLISRLMKSNAGIAYDEAVLVLAMVSSLGAFVAVTVPWDRVFKGDTTRVTQQLESIASANQVFYERYHLWPHQTTNGSTANNAAVLVTQNAMKFPYNTMKAFSPALKNGDYQLNKDANTLMHTFGEGGAIKQRSVAVLDGEYLEISFENIALKDAKKIDAKIDGVYDPDNGKVTILGQNGGDVTLVYRANKL